MRPILFCTETSPLTATNLLKVVGGLGAGGPWDFSSSLSPNTAFPFLDFDF